MSPVTENSHILIDREGRAWIDDSNVKVIEVVLDHLAYGWSPEEIRRQHSRLALGQIYAALSYYHDHRAAFDEQIEASLKAAENAAKEGFDSPIRRRLQDLGRL